MDQPFCRRFRRCFAHWRDVGFEGLSQICVCDDPGFSCSAFAIDFRFGIPRARAIDIEVSKRNVLSWTSCGSAVFRRSCDKRLTACHQTILVEPDPVRSSVRLSHLPGQASIFHRDDATALA